MHRNRTWQIDPTELRSQRNRILPIEGGDGSTFSIDFTTGVFNSSLLTFTRSTTSTYINRLGNVTSAAINEPRFDYNPTTVGEARGLLIEAPATNLIIQGTDCWGGGSSVWGRSNGVNINAVSGSSGTLFSRINGPDNGTLTGTSITKDNLAQYVRLSATATVEAVKQYTYSMYARADITGETNFRLAVFNGGTHISTVGGCSDPSVTITNSVEFGSQFANMPTTRWVRVWVVFTTLAAQTSLIATVYPNVNNTTATANFIWGAQLELGSVPSSVIPTLASTITRAADLCFANNISSWYTQGIGTMLFVGRPIQSVTRNYLNFSTGTSQPRLLMYGSTPTEVVLFLENSTGANLIFPSGALTLGSVNRIAASFKQAQYSCVVNGGTVATSTTASPAMPTSGINRLNIGMREDQLNQFGGHVMQVKYYPIVLPNAQIKALTTP